jgi:hypothetical protein
MDVLALECSSKRDFGSTLYLEQFFLSPNTGFIEKMVFVTRIKKKWFSWGP